MKRPGIKDERFARIGREAEINPFSTCLWHFGYCHLRFHASANFKRHLVEGRDQEAVEFDGFWRSFVASFGICPKQRRHFRLKAALPGKEGAHSRRVLRARLAKIEMALVDCPGVKRDQKRGVAPKGTGPAYAFAPERDVPFWRKPEEFLRQAGFGVERRSPLPFKPANVVLLSGEANFLVWHRRGEMPVTPCARELARKPSMARLRNGDYALFVLSQQHR